MNNEASSQAKSKAVQAAMRVLAEQDEWRTDAPPNETEHPNGALVWVTVNPSKVVLWPALRVRQRWHETFNNKRYAGDMVAWQPLEPKPEPYQSPTKASQ